MSNLRKSSLVEEVKGLNSSATNLSAVAGNSIHFAGDCIRKLWYHRNNTQQADGENYALRNNLELGKYIEEKVLSDIEKCGYTVLYRQKKLMDEDLQVVGHIDGYIQELGIFVEVKTLNRFTFADIYPYSRIENYLEKDDRSSLIYKHYCQAMYYLYLGRNLWGAGKLPAVKGIALIYYCKDTGQMKEFRLSEVDLGLVNRLRREFKAVNNALKDGYEVEHPYGIDLKRDCAYCPYRDICRADDENPFTEGKTLVVDNDELKTIIKRRQRLKKSRRELEQVNTYLKDYMRREGFSKLISDDVQITFQKVKRKSFKDEYVSEDDFDDYMCAKAILDDYVKKYSRENYYERLV